jgi:hypothetical protein
MTPVAHAGHWLVNIAYAMPFLILLVWMAWNRIQERRGKRKPEEIPPEPSLDDVMNGRA